MCLVFLLALVAPRVVLGAMWVLGDRVDMAFDTLLWPILGIVFLPWATIMYVLVWEPIGGVTQNEWLIVAAAAAVDVLSWASRMTQTTRPYG